MPLRIDNTNRNKILKGRATVEWKMKAGTVEKGVKRRECWKGYDGHKQWRPSKTVLRNLD